MGTRSRIAVMHGNNAKSVYCHWDGYLEHNGALLNEYYDSAKANHLVSLGDVSSLNKTIGEKHPFSYIGVMSANEYDAQYGEMTTFYGRDREEKNVDFQTSTSFEDFFELCDKCGAEYYYVMQNGVWYFGTTYVGNQYYQTLTPLAETLASRKETENV